MEELMFKIVNQIGVINEHPTGWTRELNIVSWNGGQAKYDIRDWNEDHSRMTRGITLTEEEMQTIVNLLQQ